MLQRLQSMDLFPGPLRLFVTGIYILSAALWLWAPLSFLVFGRRRVEAAVQHLRNHVRSHALVGTAALCLATTLLLLIPSSDQVLGIAARLIIQGAFWLAAFGGYAVVAVLVTDTVFPERASIAWTMLGGGLLVILQVVPLIGPLFMLWFLILALGSFILSLSREFQRFQ